MNLRHVRSGSMLIDILLGVSVLGIVVGAITFTLLFSQRSTLSGGDRIRGTMLATQAIEAVRSIRDADFAGLTAGTHGVVLADGQWTLSGTGTSTEDGFETSIIITSIDAEHVSIEAQTSWRLGLNRSGSVILHSELTDWRSEKTIGNWSTVSLQGAYIDDDTPLFNRAAYNASYAFVTSEISAGGVGLYIFDITNLSSPTRVADSFDLTAAGYDVEVVGGYLFVVTNAVGAELQIYDITSPTTLSIDNLIESVNIPGDATARAMTIYGDTLFIVTAQDGTESEVFSYDITDPEDISLLDSFNDDTTFNDIDLHEGYAYIASANDTMELRVLDVFDPSDIEAAIGDGYNLTDVPDGLTIAATGTSALLGRDTGDATEELILFDVSSSPVPSSARYSEIGGRLNHLDVEPTGVYAFAASDVTNEELQVFSIPLFILGSPPQVEEYDTSTGEGRGVLYNVVEDRVFLMTSSAFIILQPGS